MADADAQNLPRRARPSWTVVAAQVLLVAALAAWLLAGRPIGWGDEWRWSVLGAAYPARYLLAPLLTLAGFGALVIYLWRALRREKIAAHRRGLAWSVAVTLTIGAGCLQLALWTVAPGSVQRLAAVQLSDVSTGYLAEAYRIDDPGQYLRTYAAEMPRRPEHVATHPPGATLFFYAVRRLGRLVPGLNRAALVAGSTAIDLTITELAREVVGIPTVTWLRAEGLATAMLASWLLGACGALIPLVLFAALRGVLGDERALAAAALAALAPTLLLFFPLLDELVALLGTLMLAALAATQRHWGWAGVAGVVAAAALFVSLGALALVAVAGVFLLLRAIKQAGQSTDASWGDTRSVFVPLITFAGGLAVGLGLWYAAGVDAIAVFEQGLTAHSSITGRASLRSYHVWVWLNLVEFAIFLGLPLTVLVVASVRRMIGELRPMSGSMLPAYLGLAALVTLLVVDISGTVKGETGRLWLLFAPYLAAGAAPTAVGEDGRGWRLLAVTAALTAVQLLLMAWTMQPIVRPY